MKTYWLSFAGSTVAVEYDGLRATRIVDFLYRHILPAAHTNPHLTYRLVSNESGDELLLYQGDALLQRSKCEGSLAEHLLGQTCHHLADQSNGGLLFHAAGLSWQGRGLVLPGQTGAGKSTLTAWLLGQGFHYLSDELVFIPHQANDFEAFTRPLNLKRTARTALQDQFDFEGRAGKILSSPGADLIPPNLLTPRKVLSKSPLNLLIFPCYQPNGKFSLRKISKAQTGLDLMKCLANARNLPEHGFPEIARLARTTPAHRMTYGSFAQLGQSIEALLGSIS